MGRCGAVRAGLTLVVALGFVIGAVGGDPTDAQTVDRPLLPERVTLHAGTSHIAYLGPTLPVGDALTNAAGWIRGIWFYDATQTQSPWRLWSPNAPALLQGFDTLEFGRAYFVISELTVEWEWEEGERGTLGQSIALQPGFNSVVYMGAGGDVRAALGVAAVAGTELVPSQAQAPVETVWRLDPFDGWQSFNIGFPPLLQSLVQVRYGEAYFVTADAAGVWTPPPAAGGVDGGSAPASYDAGDAGPARHEIRAGFGLGHTNDQTAVAGSGDDGVRFVDAPGPGRLVRLELLGPSVVGRLDGWVDANQNGAFEAAERILAGESVRGETRLQFRMPAQASGETYWFRFRLSERGGLGPTGDGGAGEVEDHRVVAATAADPVAPELTETAGEKQDFGDAPASYGTLRADDGARHAAPDEVLCLCLGSVLFIDRRVDAEADGQPSDEAFLDELRGGDEDGVEFLSPFSTNGTPLRVRIRGGFDKDHERAKLNAWLDSDGSGSFDADERVIANLEVRRPRVGDAFDQAFSIPVPDDTVEASGYFLRFRLSATPLSGASGYGGLGEVEDYRVRREEQTDFGDLPDSYRTTNRNMGLWVDIREGFHLGDAVTDEDDGKPGPLADQDAGDDGVRFLTALTPGERAEVEVVYAIPAGVAGYLHLWVDADQDGRFWQDSERFVRGRSLDRERGSVRVSFLLPATARQGDGFAVRVLLNTSASIPFLRTWVGTGEIEDYFLPAIRDHEAMLRGTFSNASALDGDGEPRSGTCGQVAGFGDDFVVTVADGMITIRQPSTGDVNVGALSPDGTFLATSAGGESYEGRFSASWELWGINRYPVSPTCTVVYEFHLTPA